MYSSSHVPVDKGLGFDFSSIADFVKTAATTGLNVYKQQMQLKQTKVLAQAGVNAGYAMPVAGQYGGFSTGLQMSPIYGQQLNVPQPMMIPPPSSGMGTGTLLMLGGLAVGGLVLFKVLKG